MYWDPKNCKCTTFTTDCIKENGINMFETFEECYKACPIGCDDPIRTHDGRSYVGSRNGGHRLF